jgi:hypothetical protein
MCVYDDKQLRKKKDFSPITLRKFNKKLMKCYIWSISFYGAEIWTFWEVYLKYLKRFEMWCWRRMERIIWTDRVRNLEVLQSQGGREYPT